MYVQPSSAAYHYKRRANSLPSVIDSCPHSAALFPSGGMYIYTCTLLCVCTAHCRKSARCLGHSSCLGGRECGCESRLSRHNAIHGWMAPRHTVLLSLEMPGALMYNSYLWLQDCTCIVHPMHMHLEIYTHAHVYPRALGKTTYGLL